jgi:hypothetical protein
LIALFFNSKHSSWFSNLLCHSLQVPVPCRYFFSLPFFFKHSKHSFCPSLCLMISISEMSKLVTSVAS